MSQENVDVVRRAYEAFANRSAEGAEDWTSEDFRFHVPQFPGRASYRRDEMTQLWADIDEAFPEYTLVPDAYADTGDYVLVTLRESARPHESDAPVESILYHVWEVRNGKATQAWVYADRAEALEAVGLRDG